jgi:hypothetical protein
MIDIDISKNTIQLAEEKSFEMGKLKNSIRNGAGNIYGFIGEFLVQGLIGGDLVNTFDYDLICKGLKFDVKTKSCSSKPMDNYECSVAVFNIHQNCDYYTFVRVLENKSKGWVLGSISKIDYFKKARFCKKGEIDSKSHLRWVFKADCYNLPISELYPFKKLLL